MDEDRPAKFLSRIFMISPDHDAALRRLKKKMNLSFSALVRRAIDLLIKEET